MSSGGPVSIAKKYSLRSTGIWEKIRKMLAVDPNRSTGNPLVPLYRVPSTGSRPEAATYRDPTTLPAADIADNQYYNRDTRRAYPRIAMYSQSDIGGLLLYGSAAVPRIAKGNAGANALTTIKDGSLSLTDAIKESPKDIIFGEILDKDGLPPFPTPLRKNLKWELLTESESGMYSEEYPVRTFH